MQDVTTSSCRYGVDLNGSAVIVQGVTVAATTDYGVRNGSYGSFVEDAAAIDTSHGLYFLSNNQATAVPRINNFASSHNQTASIYSNNSTLAFDENLIVGLNGPTQTAFDCEVTGTTGLNDDDCSGSGAMLAPASNIVGAFVGLVSDPTNPQGATGTSGYDAITSFVTFGADTRRFIRAGVGFPDLTARGPCTGVQSCAILDLALKSADTLLRNRNALPTGNDVTTHAWFNVSGPPADQAACDARVPGSVFVAGSPNRCASVFLKHAWELLDDGIGDEDALCESGETCEFARNIGGYQGHGAFVSAGTFTAGTLSGITLVQRQTNGY